MDVWARAPADGAPAWYVALMAPNTKGPQFAWLDPSRLYCNSQALSDCVNDLLGPFRHDAIDLVAGIDAMGFILGASIASTLGKGFLAVRKAGHLCVSSQRQTYSDYTGREKTMEVRDDVIKAGEPRGDATTRRRHSCFYGPRSFAAICRMCVEGVRVLLVDQWVETGGTMKAAIQLLERMGAAIVGVAAVAMENTEGGKWIQDNYKCSHCIPAELQSQIDGKHLDSFKSFQK
ncbi:adenine phosphoribosyltransferase isoform X1 [Vanacampus margaritifer]